LGQSWRQLSTAVKFGKNLLMEDLEHMGIGWRGHTRCNGQQTYGKTGLPTTTSSSQPWCWDSTAVLIDHVRGIQRSETQRKKGGKNMSWKRRLHAGLSGNVDLTAASGPSAAE